jgi:hypothetical protein
MPKGKFHKIGNLRINVTQRRMRETAVAVKNNKNYTF